MIPPLSCSNVRLFARRSRIELRNPPEHPGRELAMLQTDVDRDSSTKALKVPDRPGRSSSHRAGAGSVQPDTTEDSPTRACAEPLRDPGEGPRPRTRRDAAAEVNGLIRISSRERRANPARRIRETSPVSSRDRRMRLRDGLPIEGWALVQGNPAASPRGRGRA